MWRAKQMHTFDETVSRSVYYIPYRLVVNSVVSAVRSQVLGDAEDYVWNDVLINVEDPVRDPVRFSIRGEVWECTNEYFFKQKRRNER
jgi:hypothetical protein